MFLHQRGNEQNRNRALDLSSGRFGAQDRVSAKKEWGKHSGSITPPGEWSSFWVIRFTYGSFYFRVIGNNLEILS
jgi:hypothetical protein